MQWNFREQGELLVETFCKTFTPEDDVELWIKSNSSFQNPLAEIPRITRKYPEMRDKVIFVKNFVNDMQPFYQQFNSFVLPVALEGFGLTFLEAMLSGLKPIGPTVGATEEFMNKRNSYPIEYGPYEEIGLYIPPTVEPHCKWRLPKKESLAEMMLKARDRKEHLPKSEIEKLRKKYSWKEKIKEWVDYIEQRTV